jgi:hypothetical protein
MAYTPGPWVAKISEDPQWKVTHSGQDFSVICQTSQRNDEANAKLIAAAPELLEALEFIVHEKQMAKQHVWIEDRCLLELIKKAKGEL